MSNPVGRPSKYNDEIQAKADAYVMSWRETGDIIPSRAGLCCFIGIGKSVTYEWERLHPKFSDTCKAIEVMQERTALNGGMSGDYNPTITKLVLANHGYSDKQQTDLTSSDGSMTPTRIELVAPSENS